MTCIEHPDHTGSSANPLAPWNQRDADDLELQCDSCHEPPSEPSEAELGGPCQNVQPEYDRAGNAIPPCEGRYEAVEHD